jgi:hypothetical protein
MLWSAPSALAAGLAPRSITQTVVDPGAGGPSPASVPVVFRRSVDQFLVVMRFAERPATLGGSPAARGSLNGYTLDPGGAPDFLRWNRRAKCFFMTFTGVPPRKRGTKAWRFERSLPRLDHLGRGDTVTFLANASAAAATSGADQGATPALIPGPTVEYRNVPVRVTRGPLKDIGDNPALNNKNAQRYLSRIGCDGAIKPTRYTGRPERRR